MKTTRRTLFSMLAGLFAGFGAAKAAPAIITAERWTKPATGEWIRVAYTVATPPDGLLVTYELLNDEWEVMESLKENPDSDPGRCWKTGFTLDDFVR